MNNVEFLLVEQSWMNHETRYWFDVDGQQYAVVENEGSSRIVDSEGFPVNEREEHRLASLLIVTDFLRAQ